MKNLLKIMFTMVLCIVVVGCGSKDSNSDKTVKLGIIQYVEHDALDATREGFLEELKNQGFEEGKNLEVNYQNAQGDQANLKTISSKLAKESDLIFAIATPAAQSIANETKDVPILFSAVTDPVASNIVKDMDKPGANVSGTIDGVDITKQIELLKKAAPDAKTVGLLYNAAEANSKIQIEAAKKEIEKQGLKTFSATAATTNDVRQATVSAANNSDVIYTPTDNTIASAMKSVGEVAKEKKIVVIAASEGQVMDGGLASFGVNYKKLGEQTAVMAAKIFKDEAKIEEMSVEQPNNVEVVVNEDMAKALGIDPATLK